MRQVWPLHVTTAGGGRRQACQPLGCAGPFGSRAQPASAPPCHLLPTSGFGSAVETHLPPVQAWPAGHLVPQLPAVHEMEASGMQGRAFGQLLRQSPPQHCTNAPQESVRDSRSTQVPPQQLGMMPAQGTSQAPAMRRGEDMSPAGVCCDLPQPRHSAASLPHVGRSARRSAQWTRSRCRSRRKCADRSTLGRRRRRRRSTPDLGRCIACRRCLGDEGMARSNLSSNATPAFSSEAVIIAAALAHRSGQ